MKKITIKKTSNGTMVKRPLLVVYSESEFTEQQIAKFREKAWRRCINSATVTVRTEGKLGNVLIIFDVYVIEQLSTFQRFRHRLSIIKAAVLGYMGISPAVIVIV